MRYGRLCAVLTVLLIHDALGVDGIACEGGKGWWRCPGRVGWITLAKGATASTAMRIVWESVREQERGACAGLTVGRVGQSLIERGCVAGCASASILRRGGLCMHKLARAVWTCVALLLHSRLQRSQAVPHPTHRNPQFWECEIFDSHHSKKGAGLEWRNDAISSDRCSPRHHSTFRDPLADVPMDLIESAGEDECSSRVRFNQASERQNLVGKQPEETRVGG